MKIGLLSYRSNPYSGGQGIYLKHLSLALLNLGHEVDVISGPPYPDLHEDIKLIKIPSLNLFELEDNLRLRSFRSRFLLNPIDLIEWRCDTCDAAGTISNWQGSMWDKKTPTIH